MNVVIVGSSGAIGNALLKNLKDKYKSSHVYSISSKHKLISKNDNVFNIPLDYKQEASIEKAASFIYGSIDLAIVTTGILHNKNISPEKSLQQIDKESLTDIIYANTIFPTLVGKHLIPKLSQNTKSIFAVLSARVGSISDNRLGGWYSYRMSKAALNMFIKSASIESTRTNKTSIIVGLHPGTVDSDLSKPYQKNVPPTKLFTPDYSAHKLLHVLSLLDHDSTGKIFDWNNQEILP